MKADDERVGALHRLVQSVMDPADRSAGEPDRLAARYGARHRQLRERAARRPLSEIDIALYAQGIDRDQAICAFAIMFNFPIELAERSVLSSDTGLLLLACRSGNFAWSTVSHLLAMTPEHPANKAFLMQCCEDYHAILLLDARRFMRLLRINLNNRTQDLDQVIAELRTKLR